MSDYAALLDQLHGVTWPARRAARGTASGAHRSRLTGASPEFTEYRPYRQGDDTRRIDWRLLARTNRVYLRITNDHATVGTTFVLDASASMAYPETASGATSKWRRACELTVGLAAVSLTAGDPVGAVVVGDAGVRRAPPRARRGALGELTRVLHAVAPAGAAPLAPTVAGLRTAARLVLVGDLLGD